MGTGLSELEERMYLRDREVTALRTHFSRQLQAQALRQKEIRAKSEFAVSQGSEAGREIDQVRREVEIVNDQLREVRELRETANAIALGSEKSSKLTEKEAASTKT